MICKCKSTKPNGSKYCYESLTMEVMSKVLGRVLEVNEFGYNWCNYVHFLINFGLSLPALGLVKSSHYYTSTKMALALKTPPHRLVHY